MAEQFDEWPRDLIEKATGKKKAFTDKKSVPPGWFTIAGVKGDQGVEVNPARVNEPANTPQPTLSGVPPKPPATPQPAPKSPGPPFTRKPGDVA